MVRLSGQFDVHRLDEILSTTPRKTRFDFITTPQKTRFDFAVIAAQVELVAAIIDWKGGLKTGRTDVTLSTTLPSFPPSIASLVLILNLKRPW